MGWHSGEDKWGRLAGRVYPISWAAQGIRQMKSVLRRPGSQGHRNWIHGVHPSTASRVKGFSFVRMIFMVCCEGSGHGWLRTLEKPCKHSGCCSEASVFQMKVSWLSRGVAKDLHGSRWWLDWIPVCVSSAGLLMLLFVWAEHTACSLMMGGQQAVSLVWMQSGYSVLPFILGKMSNRVCVCVYVCAGSARLWSVPYPGVPNAPLVAVELWSPQIVHWCIPCKPLSCTESRSSFQCGSWIYLHVCKSEATGIKVVRGKKNFECFCMIWRCGHWSSASETWLWSGYPWGAGPLHQTLWKWGQESAFESISGALDVAVQYWPTVHSWAPLL